MSSKSKNKVTAPNGNVEHTLQTCDWQHFKPLALNEYTLSDFVVTAIMLLGKKQWEDVHDYSCS